MRWEPGLFSRCFLVCRAVSPLFGHAKRAMGRGTGRGAGRGGRTEVVRAKDEVTSLAGTTASALTAFSQMTTVRRGSGDALVKKAEGTDSLQGRLSRTVSSEQLQADRNARALALAAKMTAVAGGPLMSPGISPG